MTPVSGSPISTFVTLSSTFGAEDLFHKENSSIKPDIKHQRHCHETIMQAASGLRGRCLVLGVGDGSNTPLEELCTQFEQVTIVDYDKAMLLKAQKIVSAEKASRLALIHLDITGGMVHEWMRWVDTIIYSIPDKNPKHFEAFWESMSSYMRELHPKTIPDEILAPSSYSLTISMLLESQLVACPVSFSQEKICAALGKKFYKPIPEEAQDQYTDLGRRCWNSHEADLVRWTQPGGRMLFIDTISSVFVRIVHSRTTIGPTQVMLSSPTLFQPLFEQDPAPQTRQWRLERDRAFSLEGDLVIDFFNVLSLIFQKPLDEKKAADESIVEVGSGSSTGTGSSAAPEKSGKPS